MTDFITTFSQLALTYVEVGDYRYAVWTDKERTQPWLASITVKGQLNTMLLTN